MNRLLTVSILMPVRDEASYIQRSLEAIFAQDYPSDRIEIIVADGISTDSTREIVRNLQANHPNLQMIDNPGQIVSTGLNAALCLASGEIIMRVDGHTLIASDYFRQCVSVLQRTCAENVGGKMNASGQNAFGQVVALATSSPFGVGGARFHYSHEEELVDTVYMGAWWKDTFTRIGLFDEELVRNQDDEFNYRLREKGGEILLCPQIKSVYTVRSNPCSLWRQYYQYGFWKVRVLQKHPHQMRPRQFVPPKFVATLIGLFVLAFFLPLARYLFALIIGLYLLANLVASLWTSAHKGWRHLPLLPLVYAMLHISYGLGFLVGLVKFANRWSDKQGKVPTWSDEKKFEVRN